MINDTKVSDFVREIQEAIQNWESTGKQPTGKYVAFRTRPLSIQDYEVAEAIARAFDEQGHTEISFYPTYEFGKFITWFLDLKLAETKEV